MIAGNDFNNNGYESHSILWIMLSMIITLYVIITKSFYETSKIDKSYINKYLFGIIIFSLFVLFMYNILVVNIFNLIFTYYFMYLISGTIIYFVIKIILVYYNKTK